MEPNQNQNPFYGNRKDNKGFTIHMGADGKEYVGHLIISEKSMDPKVVAQMQKPENMLAILHSSSIELRPFVPEDQREKRTVSAMESAMAGTTEPGDTDSAELSEDGLNSNSDADDDADGGDADSDADNSGEGSDIKEQKQTAA